MGAPVAPAALMRRDSTVPESWPFPRRHSPAPAQYCDVGVQVNTEPKATTDGREAMAREEYDVEVTALKADIAALRKNEAYLLECGQNWKRELDDLRKKCGER